MPADTASYSYKKFLCYCGLQQHPVLRLVVLCSVMLVTMYSEVSTTPSAATPVIGQIAQHGYAFVQGPQAYSLLGLDALATVHVHSFVHSWQHLEHDQFLADGGRYRLRRHASLIQALQPPSLNLVPYRPHWQAKAYNNLHGGVLRTFAPVEEAVAGNPVFQHLIMQLGQWFAQLRATPRWFVEAHQFRLDARSGQALPTPEGAHRDGVDYVALVLIERADVEGALTTIYSAKQKEIARTTLMQPWSLMLLDDARVTHATTAISPSGPCAWRDTLVLTYRHNGFMDPPQPAQA
jgi:hypothetical protein